MWVASHCIYYDENRMNFLIYFVDKIFLANVVLMRNMKNNLKISIVYMNTIQLLMQENLSTSI